MSKEQFKILSPRDHVRIRPGMYLGSTSVETVDRFVLGQWQPVAYVPALSKMIDEIIDNAIDEAIRTDFQHATEISVVVDEKKNSITVEDNGRGIPQEEVECHTGKKMPRPVAAWTATNAGTSFDDERVTIGANGVGSACTNFMSSAFVGKTWSRGKLVTVSCTDGANNVSFTIGKRLGSGTIVTFTPDFSLLDVNSLAEANVSALVQDRLTSLQMAFPEIRFKFNKRRIKETTTKKYADLFKPNPNSSVIIQVETVPLNYFITSSEDGFRSNTYINGVNCRLGGNYTDYIVSNIVTKLQVLIQKKHKIEVTRATIKSGLTFVMFARHFENPKFDSQTKERLTSSISEVKTHCEAAGPIDFDKVARKVMNSPDIIDPIIEAQLAKKLAADKRAATLAQKRLKKVKVEKHIAASSRDATLFLCEGDSAIGFMLKVRDPKLVGGYPLRGVVMNTWNMTPADVLKNKELSELIAILNLNINDPDSVDDMAYKNVAILADADHDGNHIAGLLMAFFFKFWPRLFDEGRIHMTRTPIMISADKSDEYWFYSYDEAKQFKASKESTGFHHRYIKGLASLTEEEYHIIINDPVFATIEIDDANQFEMMFGADAGQRKVWLS